MTALTDGVHEAVCSATITRGRIGDERCPTNSDIGLQIVATFRRKSSKLAAVRVTKVAASLHHFLWALLRPSLPSRCLQHPQSSVLYTIIVSCQPVVDNSPLPCLPKVMLVSRPQRYTGLIRWHPNRVRIHRTTLPVMERRADRRESTRGRLSAVARPRERERERARVRIRARTRARRMPKLRTRTRTRAQILTLTLILTPTLTLIPTTPRETPFCPHWRRWLERRSTQSKTLEERELTVLTSTCHISQGSERPQTLCQCRPRHRSDV